MKQYIQVINTDPILDNMKYDIERRYAICVSN